MSKYIVKIKKMTLPVIPVRGIVAFPSANISFEISDDVAVKAAEAAFNTDAMALICAYRSIDAPSTLPDGLFQVGTVCKIKQTLKTADGNLRVLAEGYSRATVTEFRPFADYILAEANSKVHLAADEDAVLNQAYCRAILTEAKSWRHSFRRSATIC